MPKAPPALALAIVLFARSAQAAEPVVEVGAPAVTEDAKATRIALPIHGHASPSVITTARRVSYRFPGAKLGRAVDRGALVPASKDSPVESVLAVENDAGVEIIVALRADAQVRHATREEESGATIELEVQPSDARPPPVAPAPKKRPDEDDDRASIVRGPVVIPVLFESAFVQTHFGFELEVGQTSFVVPPAIAGTATNASVVSGFERVSVGAKVLDFLSIDVAGNTRLVLGATDETSKALGSDVFVGAQAGVSFFLDRLARGTLVGLRVVGGVAGGGELLTAKAVQDNAMKTLNAPETLGDVTAPLSERYIRFAVHGAQVLGPLTLQSSFGGTGFIHDFETGPRTARVQQLYAGSDFDFGFSALWDFQPVGVSGEFSLAKPVSRTHTDYVGTSQLVAFEDAIGAGGGVYYTGRKELSLGLFASAIVRETSPAKVTRQARIAYVYVF